MSTPVTSSSHRLVTTTITETVSTSSPCTTTNIIHPDVTVTPTSTITSTITLTTATFKSGVSNRCLQQTTQPNTGTSKVNQGPSTKNSYKPLASLQLVTRTVLSPPCSSKVHQCVTSSDKEDSVTASLSLGTAPACSNSGLGNSAILALSGLLGTSIVVLILVTAGWIWTCWRLRKRGGMETNSKINRQVWE